MGRSIMDDMVPLLSSYFDEHATDAVYRKLDTMWVWTTVPVPFSAHDKAIWVPFTYCQQSVVLVDWSTWVDKYSMGWQKLRHIK